MLTHQAYHGQYLLMSPVPLMPPYPAMMHSYGQHFQGWLAYTPFALPLQAPAPATAPNVDQGLAGNMLNVQLWIGGKLFHN
jgi:hypothetical protein